MTMILGAAGLWYGLLVSDRLVTLQRRGGAFAGPHDTVANKSVVFLTEDGVAAFGYTGNAYLDGLPTDQWIAQVLWGAPILPDPRSGELPFMRRGQRPAEPGFNRSLVRLRRALAETKGGDGVWILGTGWRIRRRRLTPILIDFSAWREGGAEQGLRMRSPRARVFMNNVGAEPSHEHIGQAFDEAGPAPGEVPAHADWLAEVFTATIRRTAAVNPTVGRHVMQVTLVRPPMKKVICRFEPLTQHHGFLVGSEGTERLPAAYSPWIVTDHGFNPSLVMAGLAGSLSFPMGGWTFELTAPTTEESDFGFLTLAQPRAPMPGQR